MKRAVAVPAASMDAVNAVQASVTQFKNERRGITLESLAGEGATFATGFGGTGAEPAGVAVTGFGGTGGLDSSFVIGISSYENHSYFKKFMNCEQELTFKL